jgi:hypothetical protein
MASNINNFFLALSGCALISACGSKGDGLTEIPELAPLVQTSLPSSLQISGTQLFAAQDYTPNALDSTYLESLFKTGSYGKISGGNGKGYINAMLEDLDYRFNELKTRFSDNPPTCFSNTAEQVEFDFTGVSNSTTSVDNMLKITLDLQCNDYFGSAPGEQSGEGSGLLFGKKDNDYSLVLLLNSKTESNSAFGYYAKVTGKDTDDEAVNLIFAEARPSGSTTNPSGLSAVARIFAKPKAKVYEMAIAASDASRGNPISGGASPNISCGFHGITNGTLVYVKAIDQTSGSSTCANAYSTELCLNATDLSAAAGGVSECATIKAAMTIGTSTDIDDWDYTDVTTAKSAALYTAMTINTDAIKAKTTAAASE